MAFPGSPSAKSFPYISRRLQRPNLHKSKYLSLKSWKRHPEFVAKYPQHPNSHCPFHIYWFIPIVCDVFNPRGWVPTVFHLVPPTLAVLWLLRAILSFFLAIWDPGDRRRSPSVVYIVTYTSFYIYIYTYTVCVYIYIWRATAWKDRRRTKKYEVNKNTSLLGSSQIFFFWGLIRSI
jgi:hypothetical protein